MNTNISFKKNKEMKIDEKNVFNEHFFDHHMKYATDLLFYNMSLSLLILSDMRD